MAEEEIKKILLDSLNVGVMTSRIINVVINYIAEEVEELNTVSSLFRSSIARSVEMIVNAAYKKQDKCLIFPNVVPGFTTVIIKKAEVNEVDFKEIKRDPKNEINELKLVNNVLSRFFKASNNSKALVIENEVMIFAFLPVADIRKNLKELEIYVK